jgi:hypothetical protein
MICLIETCSVWKNNKSGLCQTEYSVIYVILYT